LSYLPIFLKLRDRSCVVVGGGVAATKSVESLLNAEARLTVVRPQVTGVIEKVAEAGHLQLVSRPYARGDLRGFYLAYAATGVPAVDEQIARDAGV
jgi:precorrin-2 dehydrogenase